MLFNSYAFMVFFPAVLIVLFVLPRKARHGWLLFASYAFYIRLNPFDCWRGIVGAVCLKQPVSLPHATPALLLAFITLITYFAALYIERVALRGQTQRARNIMIAAVAACISCLAVFKYPVFLLSCLNKALQIAELHPLSISFNIVLPIGISFYTFQSIGYVIDIYRAAIGRQKGGGAYVQSAI